MAVTRRGDITYLNDGYSDRAYDVEIASNIYNPEKYRVKASSEGDALEMVLDYKLSKGEQYPFATEEEFNQTFGDDSWMDQCVYVDPGYWISIAAFIIRPASDGKRVSSSASGKTPVSRTTKGGSRRFVPVIAEGVRISDYSAPSKDGPLEDRYGNMLVRCNNCMTIFNERDTRDGPRGDVCPYCGADGNLMDMTIWDIFDGPYAVMKRSDASKPAKTTKSGGKAPTSKTCKSKSPAKRSKGMRR